MSPDLPKLSLLLGALERCPGQYCGRTIDDSGKISDCGVSLLLHLFMYFTKAYPATLGRPHVGAHKK